MLFIKDKDFLINLSYCLKFINKMNEKVFFFNQALYIIKVP